MESMTVQVGRPKVPEQQRPAKDCTDTNEQDFTWPDVLKEKYPDVEESHKIILTDVTELQR